MKWATFSGAAMLAITPLLMSCSGPSAGELAEREYRAVDQPGSTTRDKCEAARKVAAAYLGGDDDKYRTWQMKANLDCQDARIGF